jgi:phosphate/phosphite/phosphonate ABC transporter binding protein
MGRPLRFGVSRHHGGQQLVDGARRFASVLGEALKRPLQLVVASDYDRLLEGVLIGGIDLAWMPPLLHSRAVAEGALLAAVSERRGERTYRSALLVRDDSRFRALADLSGARVAWTDRSSASGYLFPRLHLEAAGIDPVHDLDGESFLGTPARACAAVVAGEADLCACYVSDVDGASWSRARAADDARGLARAQAAMLDQVRDAVGEAAAAGLRVLDVTDAIPPDGLVLGAPLDGWEQARLRDALLALHRSPDGADAIRGLLHADRLAPVTGDVARPVERLGRRQ